MKGSTQNDARNLKIENSRLKERVAALEKIELEYRKNLESLKDKEAFNFALFQHNPAVTVVVDRDGKIVKTNMAKKRYGGRIPAIGNIMYKDYASRHAIDMYNELMGAIESGSTRHFKVLPYGDKFLSVTISPFTHGAIIISQDITEEKITERELKKMVNELKRALDEVETLRGLLPICASCKKIRDDQGYWNHIEVYFCNHSHVDFTHTLCPECIRHFYPEYWKKQQEKQAKATV